MVFNFEHKGYYHKRNVGVFITSAIIVIGIYIPIICYYLLKFYRTRNTPYLQNRYPELTITSVASIIAVLFFGTWCGFLYINGLDHKYLLIIFFFILVAGSVFAHCIMLRIWLLYFTVRVNKATLNDKWQSIINPNKNIQENPCPTDNPNAFYLQNRKTFGNYHFCRKKLKKAILFDATSALILFGIYFILFYTEVNRQIIHILFSIFVAMGFLFMFVFPLCVISFVYRLIPDFYDEFHVRDELMFLARMYMISLICLLVMATGFAIDQLVIMDRENSNFSLFYFAVNWQINALILFCAALAMIKRYPQRLAKMYNDANASIHSSKSIVSSIKMSEYKQVPNEANIHKIKKNIKIKDVLTHEECFEVFIEHLAHEFAMESLLSMLEFTHYRDYILYNETELKQQYNGQVHQSVLSDSITTSKSLDASVTISTNNINITMKKYFDLPENIVKSDIVYPVFYKGNSKCGEKINTMGEYMTENGINGMEKAERIKKYKKMAYEIYDKYVRMGAEYEINISYGVRMGYMSIMSNEHIWINSMNDFDEIKLFTLFDDCYDEMIRLMQQSFARFKRTSKFDKVSAVLLQNTQ
eukprot:193490_1